MALGECGEPENADVALTVKRYLESNPRFRNRAQTIEVEQSSGRIILTGTLPSYFLKQMLQEVLRPLHLRLENHVNVISESDGGDPDQP
ncbi:MAG: BON domain-containing protein [Planctomycetaceae bacterium]|nr:BON domain-containing protein [Planctomycetales bacterium]MCB9924140.1 BON domain-containing protein [Planctomycetaceae bacterium]